MCVLVIGSVHVSAFLLWFVCWFLVMVFYLKFSLFPSPWSKPRGCSQAGLDQMCCFYLVPHLWSQIAPRARNWRWTFVFCCSWVNRGESVMRRSVLCWGVCSSVPLEHNPKTPANTLSVKGPVPATEQSNSGDLERQGSVGCFTYIGLTSKKSLCFQALTKQSLLPSATKSSASPVGGTATSSQPGLLQGNLVSRWPGQTARAAPAPPWGKQEGAQPGMPGRQSLSWQRFTASKGQAGRKLQAVNRWLEGGVESGKGSTAQGQILLFCVLCVGWGWLEVPYMWGYFCNSAGHVHLDNKCVI